MPNYRRAILAGGTFFLTIVTENRAPILTSAAARAMLHRAITETVHTRPFELVASVLLPDHLHLLLTLPLGDTDFSRRIAAIKARFTRMYLAADTTEAPQSDSRARQGYRGVWQKRFWEHTIRDTADLATCLDYIHFNPVKHRLASCPHAWQWSTFHRYVTNGHYPREWQCTCTNPPMQPPIDLPPIEPQHEPAIGRDDESIRWDKSHPTNASHARRPHHP